MKVTALYLVPKLETSGAIPPLRHTFLWSAQGQLQFRGTIREQFSQVLDRTYVKTCAEQGHKYSEPPFNGTARVRIFFLLAGSFLYGYLKFGFSGFNIPGTLKRLLLKTGFRCFPSRGITHRRQLVRISVLSSGVYPYCSVCPGICRERTSIWLRPLLLASFAAHYSLDHSKTQHREF